MTLRALDQRLRVLRETPNTREESLRHATACYHEGYSSLLEHIDTQRQVLAVDLAMVQLQADGLQARVGLH